MRSGGSNRRPPFPNRLAGGLRAGDRVRRDRKAAAGWSPWRRLRQRIRSLWRWTILRQARTWLPDWLPGGGRPLGGGEVRHFPTSRGI